MSKLSLREKFADWAGNSPLIGVPIGIGVTGLVTFLGFIDGMESKFDVVTKPLSYFEPQQVNRETVSWVNTVMGQGRIERLIARLADAGIPHVDKSSQTWALSQSYAGIVNLPLQGQLVKYGLNDRAVLHAARGIDLAVSRSLDDLTQTISLEEWKQKPRTFIEGGFTSQDGLINATTGEIIRDRNFFIGACVKASLESCSFHDRKYPATKDKLAEVVFDWLVDDVMPAVPDIFGERIVPEFIPERKSHGPSQAPQPA